MTMAQAWERLDYEIAAYAHPDCSMGDLLPRLSFHILNAMKEFETFVRQDERAKLHVKEDGSIDVCGISQMVDRILAEDDGT